jgi:23S rRNA (uracil1939-C5)-methyltransferase
VYSQAAGPESIQSIANPGEAHLSYSVGEPSNEIPFLPADFIQANGILNQQLVARVTQALALQTQDHVAELFCGLGNFTLPIAQHCQQVTAVEGHPVLVERATQNANHNGINNVLYLQADLNTRADGIREYMSGNKLLLDPPREGAIAILKQLDYTKIERIVYVSCEPKTLARDLAWLTGHQHYHLESLQLIDMFPQTRHCESIAILIRK